MNYAFGVDLTDEAHTASLLKSFTHAKSPGTAYTIQWVVDLTAGYGDDNNRMGILLFNTTTTQTADGGGGLFLRVNTDDNNSIDIRNGINGALLSNSVNHSYNPGDQWIGQTLTFTADLTFENDGVDDRFDIAFTLTDSNSNTYNVEAADLLVSDYTGTHFGFASKWRQRGTTSSDRNAPAEFDYQSFEVTLIPEPSSAMLAGLLGAVALPAPSPLSSGPLTRMQSDESLSDKPYRSRFPGAVFPFHHRLRSCHPIATKYRLQHQTPSPPWQYLPT